MLGKYLRWRSRVDPREEPAKRSQPHPLTSAASPSSSKPERPLPKETKQEPRRRERWQIPRTGTGQKPDRPPGNEAPRRHGWCHAALGAGVGESPLSLGSQKSQLSSVSSERGRRWWWWSKVHLGLIAAYGTESKMASLR